MCGIAGILMRDWRASADPRIAARMADTMLHRGPDAEGVWNEGPVAFGHRRLKIIDLSDRAAQPMKTSDGRYVITYNGEIYNFQALRQDLQTGGAQFRSESDTEVLLQLYARDGAEMLQKVNGIFAFAIWDRAKKRLFAARDHIGVKPFYFCADSERVLFSSEIKALLAAGHSPKAERARLGEFIFFGSVAGRHTLFDGVSRLLPGEYLTFEPGGDLRFCRYFDPTWTAPGEADAETARVASALELAVERQMVSDVPVGSMCSGGVDSSAITAISARKHPGIATFCIKVAQEGYDESEFGRLVSRTFNTAHHELPSTPQDFYELLATLTWLHDEPLTHPNSVAIFQISRLAREHVVVLLSGEGADELFAGYGRYARIRWLLRLRKATPRLAASTLSAWVEKNRNGRRAARILDIMEAGSDAEVLAMSQAKTHRQLFGRIAPELSIGWEERLRIATAAREARRNDPLTAVLLHEQQTHLQTLLDRQDKMCMGASIESRVPFLDVELVRLANALPGKVKLRGNKSKAVLRDAVAGILPGEIVNRHKHAFALPLIARLGRTAPGAALVEGVCRGDLVEAGVVDGGEVRKLARQVQAGNVGHADLLWGLVSLETWWRVFISQKVLPSMAELPAWRVKSSREKNRS